MSPNRCLGEFDPLNGEWQQRGTSLRGNTPDVVQIVEIGLRAMAQRDPKNKVRKRPLCCFRHY